MQSFKSLVLGFCNHGDALQSAALALQARAKTMSYAQFVNEAARIVGDKYNVEPHESRKGGLLTFEKDSAPEQRLGRIKRLHADYGKTGGVQKSQKQEVRPRVVSAAVAQASATVIAAGMTRAEFAAFIAALKDSVSFK